MNIPQQVKILSTMTDRDHAGRHFTQRYADDVIAELEADGLIEIERPVHEPTGIPYGTEHWRVSVTELGQELVDAYPEFHDTDDSVE